IDNTKIANYKLFKYTMNCGNCEAILGITAGGGDALPLGFIGASYTRRVCSPPSSRRALFFPTGPVLPDGPVLPVLPDGAFLPDGLVLPVPTGRTEGGHQGGAGCLG